MTAPRPSIGTRLTRVRSVLGLVLYDVLLAALVVVGGWMIVYGSKRGEPRTQYLGMALAGVALALFVPDRSFQRVKECFALLFPNGIPLPMIGGSRSYDIKRQAPPVAELPPGKTPPAEDAP